MERAKTRDQTIELSRDYRGHGDPDVQKVWNTLDVSVIDVALELLNMTFDKRGGRLVQRTKHPEIAISELPHTIVDSGRPEPRQAWRPGRLIHRNVAQCEKRPERLLVRHAFELP